MDNNTLTPEEAAQNVTHGDLVVILQALMRAVDENAQETDGVYWDATTRMVDALADKMREIEYNRIRDMHFLFNVLASFNLGTRDDLMKYYNTYCVEYDKLNKYAAKEESEADIQKEE